MLRSIVIQLLPMYYPSPPRQMRPCRCSKCWLHTTAAAVATNATCGCTNSIGTQDVYNCVPELRKPPQVPKTLRSIQSRHARTPPGIKGYICSNKKKQNRNQSSREFPFPFNVASDAAADKPFFFTILAVIMFSA